MGNKQETDSSSSREYYSETERAALASNRFCVLPCYPHPFYHFGARNAIPRDPSPEGGDGAEQQAPKEGVPVTDEKGYNKWPLIQRVLSQRIENVQQLCEAFKALNKHNAVGYFVRTFGDAQSEHYARFFAPDGTLAFIQKLALRLPELFPEESSLLLLLPRAAASVTLTQEQIASLLANAFFCTLYEGRSMALCDFNHITFNTLYEGGRGTCSSTTDCIIHYFERIKESMPQGNITFERQVLTKNPEWAESTRPIRKVVASATGTIEGSGAILQADFANQYIGGGVLTGGCVQEEILFAVKTECLASMAFCAKMEPNEAILITGAEQFSKYSGYGRNYTYGGNHVDDTPRDDKNRIQTIICAMDACIPYGGGGDFKPPLFHRDLNKAYCSFMEKGKTELGPVATGNWGCGAFGGDKSIKFFQQLLAASQSGRDMWWYTFGEGYKDKKLDLWITEVMAIIEANQLTVGDVYRKIVQALDEGDSFNLFQYFIDHAKDWELPGLAAS